VDRVGESASAAELAAMRAHVVTTSRYEWMFWDAGWRRETWRCDGGGPGQRRDALGELAPRRGNRSGPDLDPVAQ
jgi:hypothetical protein